MFKFRFPFQKEDFFFSQKEKKLFFIIVRIGAGVVALCLVVLLIVAVAQSARRPAEARTAPESETAAPVVSLTETGEISKPMSISSFILPDVATQSLELEYTVFRPRLGKWDQKLIDRYWIPPSQIGLENLKKMNDKNIENLFDDIQ